MPDLADSLLRIDPTAVYLIITALVLAESALFVGFVLPGEASVLLGGMLVSVGRLDLVPLCALVICAAMIGDAVGFWVGRRCGPWLLRRRTMRRHQDRVEHLQEFLRRRGGLAILTGRMVAVLRAMTPPVAGLSGVSWRTFAIYDALGAVLWGGGMVLLGLLAGASYQRVAEAIGQFGTLALVAIVAGAGWWWWRDRRTTRSPK